MTSNNHNGGVLYSRLSCIYDSIFRWFQFPRQKMLIHAMQIPPGSRILDLGVGTGMSLPLYPRHCKVTGVDISPEMLRRARRRVRLRNLTHVEIVEMDAMEIDNAFPPATFDLFNASFVLSVIQDPLRALENMKRVGKPGCSMFLLNHSRSKHPVFSRFEKALDPVCRKIGWNFETDLESLIRSAGLRVIHHKPCFPYELFVVGDGSAARLPDSTIRDARFATRSRNQSAAAKSQTPNSKSQ